MADYSNISNPVAGKDNIGGYSNKAYFARVADIETAPTMTDLSTALAGQANKLTGDFAMLTGKKFFECYVSDDSGETKEALQGDTNGKSIGLEFSFMVPGSSDEIEDFIRRAKNDDFVFLIPDINKVDRYKVFGNIFTHAKFPAKFDKLEGGSGKNTSSVNGRVMTFKVLASSGPLPYVDITAAELTALLTPAT